METGLKKSLAHDLLVLAAFTLLLHAPFLRQPVQGDEINYLDMAAHVLQHPLTPLDFQFVFQGHMVDANGHPHPPLNAYILAVAWLVRGHFSVFFFHCFYLLFTMAIGFAAYALARRFTSRPLWAALLVAASPIVQVNTNTLAGPEAPALALLLIGAAAFFGRWFWLAGIALALAGMTALQALALPPILLLSFWIQRERPPRAAWLALAAPFVALSGWQGLQWALTGRLPAAVLAGYAANPNLSGAAVKFSSSLALLGHLGVLVTVVPLAWRRVWGLAPGLLAGYLVTDYPWWERALLVIFIALGVNALLWLWESRRQPVLTAWCLLYFAFACVAFFAGAARYLLPLAAPTVLLFVIQFHDRPRILWLALLVNVVLGWNLSFAAYEFARVYADVPTPPARPFLVNGEWGFRYYMDARGGLPLEERSVPSPGEWIVASDLSLAGKYDSLAEEIAAPLRSIDLFVRTPLRIVDRHAHAGNSSASMGLLPFSFSLRPLDRITYSRTSSFIAAPAAWTPTECDGHLVYIPAPREDAARGPRQLPGHAPVPSIYPYPVEYIRAPIRLPLGSRGTLHFALYAHGSGPAAFHIERPSGEDLFAEAVKTDGELWEPHTLPLAGIGEAVFAIEAPPAMRVGWGEMVIDSDEPAPAIASAQPELLSYLHLGDIRSRAQLGTGWYAIEDGAWRWMSNHAEAALHPLPAPAQFELQLFFPPDFMTRAGTPVTVSVSLNGKPFAKFFYYEPGAHTVAKRVTPDLLTEPVTQVSISVTPSIPPTATDQRTLGAVVQGLGFVPAQ